MLNKLEKVKVLHQHEHYRINEKIALENGSTELAKEYTIRLNTMKHVLDSLGLQAWEA